MDPAVTATEIVAFLYGMEMSWLLAPTIPLTEVFREYTASLARKLKLDPPAAADLSSERLVGPGPQGRGQLRPVRPVPAEHPVAAARQRPGQLPHPGGDLAEPPPGVIARQAYRL